MTPTAWIAIAGICVTIFLQTVGLAFWLGGISSRMRSLESRPVNDDCAKELAAMGATLIALKDDVKGRIEALEHTMRNLLMAKNTTRSRSQP